jgi:hypothetical protein
MVILMVIVLGFAAIFALKLIPIYLESYKVDKALKGVMATDVGQQSERDIRRALLRRLDIDDVRRINASNWRDYLSIVKKGEKITIEVYYDAEEQLVGNLYVVARFDKVVSN